MVVALTVESDLPNIQSTSITDLSKQIKEYFKDRSYGQDVKRILIGIMALDTTRLSHLFKIRKPSYVDFKISKDGLGNPIEVSKSLSWDVKPDYELLKDLEGIALQSIVAKAILESFNDLKLPKKVKDFNLLAFKNDLEKFFIENKLV